MSDCRKCEEIIDYTLPDKLGYGFYFRCNKLFPGEEGICSLKRDVPCPDFREMKVV